MTKESPSTLLDKFLNFIAPRDPQIVDEVNSLVNREMAIDINREFSITEIAEHFPKSEVFEIHNLGSMAYVDVVDPNSPCGKSIWVVHRVEGTHVIRTLRFEDWVEESRLRSAE